LLNLAPEEKIRDCVVVRDFNLPGHFMMMATKKGIIKKTALEQYSRPKKGGIIAIKLREDDELVDVVVTKPNDQIVLATANGMAIRFAESDARPMGRNTSGVKGISLKSGDEVVGMVVADPTATLLTACEFGYGKRTSFGPGDEMAGKEQPPLEDENGEPIVADEALAEEPAEEPEAEDVSSANRYRTQRRGGKGVIDIKTTKRNGKVVGVVPVHDTDDILMMTVRGKIQRIAASDVSVIGRNTQGVRIMSLDEGDSLTALVRVPLEDISEEEALAAQAAISAQVMSSENSAAPEEADADEADVDEQDSGDSSDESENDSGDEAQ
jgi:DNA gyrase subunit A